MLKYLKFVERAQKINEEFFLDQYELKLLDLVATAHSSGQDIFIGDLIYRKSIASSATLHGALQRLIVKRLLVAAPHSGDGRTRVVTPTKHALRRYRRLSKAMHLALEG